MTINADPEAVERVEMALRDNDIVVREYAAIPQGEMKAADAEGREVLVAVLAGKRKYAPGLVTNALRKAKS